MTKQKQVKPPKKKQETKPLLKQLITSLFTSNLSFCNNKTMNHILILLLL